MLQGEPGEGRPRRGSRKPLLCPVSPLQSPGCSVPFHLQEGFHLCDNPSFHSFVTNFTAKATARAAGAQRSKALLPVPRAGGQTPPLLAASGCSLVPGSHSEQAATLLTFINPAQLRPGGGRTCIQMQVRSAQPAPSCCQQKPVCPLASSKCKGALAKAPGFLLLNNLSFLIFKQSCLSLKMSLPPG